MRILAETQDIQRVSYEAITVRLQSIRQPWFERAMGIVSDGRSISRNARIVVEAYWVS